MAWCIRRIPTMAPRLLSLLTLSRVLPHFYSKFEADIMDEFTSQLMQRKIGKWDQQKRKNEAFLENSNFKEEKKNADFTRDLAHLSVEQLRLLFQNLIDNEDSKAVIELTKLCISHRKSPPVSILMNILSICAQNGDKDTIQHLRDLCKIHHPLMLRENSNFRDFVAEAVWMKGDVSKALEIYEEVYRENAYLRRRIRLMLKYLIANLVANASEAALSNMISFSERISRDFQDFLPLTCVWQACFLSEWFTDQNIAVELLEKHFGLCKSVINKIPYVVYVSLKCHRTEVVYRLLEILLKYKMKPQYSDVLGSLLDYQFHCGDWARCVEIINWAVDNRVRLPQKHNIELINLILNQKMKTPLVELEQKLDEKPKYDFKF